MPRIDRSKLAAARELKDRWLEQVNGGLYVPQANGKYEVSKTLTGVEGSRGVQEHQVGSGSDQPMALLEAA